MAISVLVISPRRETCEHFQSIVNQIYPAKYQFDHLDLVPGVLPDSDIAIIDTTSGDESFVRKLPDLIGRFDPRPVICLVNNSIDGDLMNVIKRYSADFLVSSRISGAGLHNSLRYAFQSSILHIDLVNQEQRYLSLFHNSVDASFFLDANFRIQATNQVFNQLFGLSGTEGTGVSFQDLLFQKDKMSSIKKALELDESIEMSLRFKRQNRTSRFMGRFRISAIRDTLLVKGKRQLRINGYHGAIKNITRSARAAEIEAKANRVAENYRLARTLAHEIRNPLTTIGLSVEQLRETLIGNRDSLLYVDIVQRCATRINNLISELLQASEHALAEKKLVDLNQIVQKSYAEARDRAQLMGITLSLEIETESVFFEMNEMRMILGVSNLLSNALDAIKTGHGKVIIGTYLDDSFYCIYVEDNGMGMDEATQEQLFDPFFTQKRDGMGLGLTTTQTIVSEHAGSIEVESTPGVGSTLTISLPVQAL